MLSKHECFPLSCLQPALWLRFSLPQAAGGLVEPEMVAGEPDQAEHRQLTSPVKTRLRQMQYQPGLLDGFLARTRLDLSNLHN